MSDIKRYYIFIFFSNLGRNLIEIYSAILLYNKGYSTFYIFFFYVIFYFIGIFVSIISLIINKYINGKYLLIISSIFYIISYLYLSFISGDIYKLVIFGILLSLSSYLYHPLRHYYAIISKNSNKDTCNILIFGYIAIIPASFIGAYIIDNYSIYLVILLIFIFLIIGIFFLPNLQNNNIDNGDIKLDKRKILFFILEQYKVLYLTIFPLYYYLYISKSTLRLGLLNLVVCLISVIFTSLFSKIKNNISYFRYLNILFCLILFLKLYIKNYILLIIIAIFEGMGVKMYEVISTLNLYDIKGNINKYLIISEVIFLLTQSISSLIFMFLNIKLVLIINIIFILLSGFILKRPIK